MYVSITWRTLSLFCERIGTHMSALLLARRTVEEKPPDARSKMCFSSFSLSRTVLARAKEMTWEAWDLKYKSNPDWNHAWGTAPGNVVRRKLMGLEPLTPGWESARLRPCLGSLQWAKGTVPTVKGDIIFDAQQTDGTVSLRITLPANLPAVLELPLTVGRVLQIDGKATRRQSAKDGYALWNLPPGTHEIVYKK